MNTRLGKKSGWRLLWLLGLVWVPLLGRAEAAPPDVEQAWRQANAWVGQFRRGHADWWRWEQAQTQAPSLSPGAEGGAALARALDVPTADVAVELAWAAHPALAGVLQRLGRDNRALVAAGRWAELDPALGWRLEGVDEVIELAAAVRKAWLRAVASELALVPTQVALDAAQVAQTLGARMVAVGNWSTLAQAPYQLKWTQAQLRWQRAQYEAAQERARLLALLQRTGQYDVVRLNAALPAVPAQAMAEPAFARWLARVQPHVQALRRDRHRSVAHLAFQAYTGSHAVATLTQDGVLKLQERVHEETQLHYNGMLKSTWELLDAVQNLAQARLEVVTAQRDFALAALDLQTALWGAEPVVLNTLGGATVAPASPSH